MEDQAPYRNLLNAMRQQAEEDKVFMKKVHDTFEELNLHNSIQANLMLTLAGILTSFSIDSTEDPVAELELDERHGSGINLYAALVALFDYGKDDDPVNLDIALAHIMREKERRILNEI